MKQKVSPEHEFLVLDTIDNSDQSHRKFILERTTSLLEAAVEKRESESNRESLIDKAKKFASILGQLLYPQSPHPPPPSAAASSSSSSISLEYASMTILDRSTVSLAQSVDIVSESLDKVGSCPACDVFLGENTLRKKFYREAVTVRAIRPRNLKLFQLALLAHVIHELYPEYALLRQQCFFFASVVIFTIEERFGVLPAEGATGDSDLADLNKSGRWRGVKVRVVTDGVINAVVRKFNEKYEEKLKMVRKTSLRNFSPAKTFKTDWENLRGRRSKGEAD